MQNDGWFIDHYRAADIIVCTGLGPWEQDGLPSFYSLKKAFEEKNIPAWFDVWGEVLPTIGHGGEFKCHTF